MIKFLRSFTERFKSKSKYGPYSVTYEILFDGDRLDTFKLTITARSQEHAWDQVRRYMAVKPVKVESVRK